MPSSNKTQKLGLNSFVGSDKPKMDDFNYDNQKLDTALGGHLEAEQLHLKAGERERYLTQQVTLFPYTGNGSFTRVLELPFTPSFCLIYPVDSPLTQNDVSNPAIVISMSGMVWPGGGTAGLTLSGSKLTLKEDPDSSVQAVRRKMNTYEQKYICLLWK